MRVRLALLASALALVWSLTVAPPGHAGPPTTCPQGGIQVSASANLHTVIENSTAETYCLAAATYALTASLHPDSGDVIQGKPPSQGQNGTIIAQTFITCNGCAKGVIEWLDGSGGTLTLISLDLSGASGDTDESDGVNGTFEDLEFLNISYSRLHDNGNAGINHVAEGLRVDHSEIDHNGSGSNNYDAGIKTVHYAWIDSVYFHDNDPNGMWWDCDAPGGVISNSIIDDHQRSGIFVEISSGDSGSQKPLPTGGEYGFDLWYNDLDGNNAENSGAYGGISVVSSMNVDVFHNEVTNSLNHEIYAYNDGRAPCDTCQPVHSGCSSGFRITSVGIHANHYGPGDIADCSLATCQNNTPITP